MTNKEKIGLRIRTMRNSRGWTQQVLADKLGFAKSRIAMYETGQREPDMDVLEALADAFNVPLFALLSDDDMPQGFMRPLPSNLKPLSELHHLKVPLIGSVAAGVPIMAEQDFDTFVDAPVKCDAALTVEGDSMAPGFQSGDIVYIRCQPDVRDGQIAVVLIDDSATLKHVYHDRDGLTLISDNPAYAPIRVNGTEHDYIAIYGIVVGFTRMFKSSNPMAKVKKGFK